MSMSLEVFMPLLGCTVFNAEKGYRSFVTFSLTTTPEVPIEEFYFWVYMCGWKIRDSEKELAHSESEEDVLVTAIEALNGKRLERLTFQQWLSQEGVLHGASLFFEQGLVMKLYQYSDNSADNEIFLTRNSAGEWMSYLSDGSIEFEPGA